MYSFLLILAGAFVLLIPLYKINFWILIIQGITAIYFFTVAKKLFSTWGEKKKKIEILKNRNRDVFRPDTFEVYMQAPCGRLVVRAVLADMEKSNEYKNLLVYKKPFLSMMKENCASQKATIYINENYIKG
jgi:hypothetical protein